MLRNVSWDSRALRTGWEDIGTIAPPPTAAPTPPPPTPPPPTPAPPTVTPRTSAPAPAPSPASGGGGNGDNGGGNAEYVPEDKCHGVPRKSLLSNCPGNACPHNGACVAYDQDDALSQATGCDYGLASTPSFCTRARGYAETCEFQCFAAYTPPSQFKFFIPFSSDIGAKVSRQPSNGNLLGLKTTDIPFLSNTFVNKIGTLNLDSTITEVMVSGGQSELGSGQRADVAIDANMLSKVPSVTSLSLLNIDLSKSDLPGILAAASPALKTLNLRNTNSRTLPDSVFDHSQQIETLTLAQNGLRDVALKLPKVTTLDLSGNFVTTISINTPNLKTLDLSGNKLLRIPLGVFALSGLKTLKLKSNSITFPLALSESQLAFLSSLTLVEFDAPATQPSTSPLLATGTKTEVKGIPVVIVSEQIANDYYDQLEQGRVWESSSGTGSLIASSSSSASREGSSTREASFPSSQPSDLISSVKGGTGLLDKNTPTTNGETNSADDGFPLATKLVLGGLGAMVFVLLFVLFVVRKRRNTEKLERFKYDPMTELGEASTRSGTDTQSSSSHVVSWWQDDDLLSHRLNAADITDVGPIKSEGSSVTWLVNYRGSRQLISKRLILGEGPAYQAKALQLIGEAKIASTLTYPTIVPLVGVAWTDKTDLQVLYEYMDNGDLRTLLERTDTSTLPWMPEKLEFAIDIIEALVYTHSFNPPLLHRNLKASNVLLDGDFKAKLGDFGCARHESDSNTMTTSDVGTGRWLAPEILSGSTSYGSSSDIYSFGVVLCELDTHRVPFAEEAAIDGEMAVLQRVTRGELRPHVSRSCPPQIREIAEACLAFDPGQRPNAMEISHRLRLLRPRAN